MKMNEEKMFKKLTGKVHVAPDSHKKKKRLENKMMSGLIYMPEKLFTVRSSSYESTSTAMQSDRGDPQVTETEQST